MPQSYRIRTQPGVDHNIQVQIDQDFDFLEILSLKITQSEIYTRMCSDYGVVVGRVIANNGYGIQNARISVFIPLTEEDSDDPIISSLYPYRSVTDKNDDGYRYNLLPYVPSYSNHVPTGTFPDREDALINRAVVEVYDKYYKFSVRTNDSGDFMIFGVPTGSQTLVMDLDLSDMGEFSLTPQDLIRMGMATPEQVAGVKFQSSTDIDSLPQIVNINKEIEVLPFWGQPEVCQLAITRTDFDLVKEANIDIEPTAVFMGSIVSTLDKHALKKNCKVKPKAGELCSLISGPGEILALRQTIFLDSAGYPVLEQAFIEQDGKVIDENGTWLIDLPMNLDYVYTNEFGQKVLSSDPKVGVPTKAKYRFKVKWNQPNTLDDPVRRAYFLVPNIREYGWENSNSDPIVAGGGSNFNLAQQSYAFSLDWSDYADPLSAINCEDTFYEFKYNQVYTISQLIDQYRGGMSPRRYMSIKNILDDTCESTNTSFPANDSQFRPDIIYVLFSIFLRVLTPVLIAILVTIHILGFLLQLLCPIISFIMKVMAPIVFGIQLFLWGVKKLLGGNVGRPPRYNDIIDKANEMNNLPNKFKNLMLPALTYPDCETCNCNVTAPSPPNVSIQSIADTVTSINVSTLSDWNVPYFYDGINDVLDSTYNLWWPDPDNSNPCPIGTGADKFDPTTIATPLQVLLAGKSIDYTQMQTNKATYDSFMPFFQAQAKTVNVSGAYVTEPRRWFSSNLTIAERLNLFNTKAKYFEGLPGSQTFAPNQIQVEFNYTQNGGIFHYDNTLTISCDAGSQGLFSAGTIVYFQNAKSSGDVNAFSADTNNEFGVPCITGSSVSLASFSKTLNYADPNSPNNNLQVTYFLTPNTADTRFHTFPVDLEYFQVITAMTIGDFATLQNNSAPPTTLWNRFLNNSMTVRMNTNYDNVIRPYVYRDIYPEIQSSGWIQFQNYNYTSLNGLCASMTPSISSLHGTPWDQLNPITAATQGYDQLLVFLVRGVDPYSTRQENRYGLGRLFGYPTHNTIQVTGNYKLNIPIQAKVQCARHNQITKNFGVGSLDTYSNTGVFYENFNYQPSQTDFSAFTTNLPSFYSALDSTQINNYNVRTTGLPGTTLLDGNNAYTDGTYGDIRVQGPRPWQRHNTPTTFGNYFPNATYVKKEGLNWTLTQRIKSDLFYLTWNTDEIVWPQYVNLGVQAIPSTTTLQFDWGYICRTLGSDLPTPLGIPSNPSNPNSIITSNQYLPQEFNRFTCDYTIHKQYYGRRGWVSGNIFYANPNLTNPTGINNTYISPSNTLGYVRNASPNSEPLGTYEKIDFYSDEADGCWTPTNNVTAQNKGYYNNESVEGGSLFGGKWYWHPTSQKTTQEVYSGPGVPNQLWGQFRHNGMFGSTANYEYFAPTYSTAHTITIDINAPGPNRYTVFRSDRLPTSTSTIRVQNNSMALQQNLVFLIGTATDDGVDVNATSDNIGVNFTPETNSNPPQISTSVTDSISDCSKMVPLGCYGVTGNNTMTVNTPPNSCFQNTTTGILGLGAGTYDIFRYGSGCYQLVQKFITGLPRDIELVLEWKSRMDVTFGACRNVFSHIFTNNWINGTLFAYSIRNDKQFDSNNQAIYKYCTDTIVFHNQTNNYYYRSSPYKQSSGEFVGKNGNQRWQITNNKSANQKNLQNPTTILNLGPRNEFIQQIVQNNEYDGYIVDKLKDTTFSDPSDLLNIFLISRLANSNFLQQLLGVGNAGILSYFSREPWNVNLLQKQKLFIDSDYAQAISTSSEFGVNPYDEDDGTPIFFFTLGSDTIVGFTFTTNNQFRDYVSPRRTIYSEVSGPPLVTDFEYIPVKTQEVPVYGWTIREIDSSNRYIFGSQHNSWDSNQNPFLKYSYQSLDRLNITQLSDYMTPTNSTIPSQYIQGIILNYGLSAGTNTYVVDTQLGNTNPYSISGGSSNGEIRINVGSPFHFYFGLIKGATAYNRFYQKWVAGEIVT